MSYMWSWGVLRRDPLKMGIEPDPFPFLSPFSPTVIYKAKEPYGCREF
jgi:hypothetical protein